MPESRLTWPPNDLLVFYLQQAAARLEMRNAMLTAGNPESMSMLWHSYGVYPLKKRVGPFRLASLVTIEDMR